MKQTLENQTLAEDVVSYDRQAGELPDATGGLSGPEARVRDGASDN
jgi:hypothetical protein